MSIRHELLRRLRDPRGERAHKGWAGRSLESVLARALLIGVVAMQGVTVLAAMASLGLETAGFVMAAAHLVVIGAALAVLRFGHGEQPLILGIWALFVVDWKISPTPESALLFAACWVCNLNAALPTFLLRGKAAWWVPLGAAVTVPTLAMIARPDWVTHPLVPGVFITTIAITVATRIGLSYLLDYTDRVDAEARALEENTAALTIRKAATHQAAEDARVLHDTAINTLGAIANGGVAINDGGAVRQRCLADIAAIEALQSVSSEGSAAPPGLREAIRPVGIRIRYDGMSDEQITATEALLPAHVVRAFSRAAGEAVQNAAKHSGAEEAVVSIIRTAEGLRVTVSDRGIGIQAGLRRGGGVERSILERAREAGIRAVIDSTPGQGTTVSLDYAFDEAPDDTRDPPVAGEGLTDPVAETVEDLVAQLRWRVVYALSAGLVGVGVVLAALNHPGQATPEWLMVALVALAGGLAWRERDRASLSVGVVLLLLFAGPAAFVLSAWSVGFGQIDPVLWQAVAPTGPLLVLMIVPLPLTVKILGFAAYVLAVGGTAASVAPASLDAASVTVVAGVVGLCLVVGVLSFIRSLAAVAARGHHEQREAFRLGLELAALEAAAEARRRWRDAGLEESVRLLRVIGEGRADPKDAAIRQRCADEEAFLRQLSLLNPELIQMGTWFARALNASRLRGVGLTLRAGGADATVHNAPQFGRALLTVIDAMPAGMKLTTAFFATTRGLVMTMVAPTPHLVLALNGNGRRANVRTLQTFGEQDLAEFVVAESES